MTDSPSVRAKLRALARVGRFRPALTAGVIVLSLFAAVLEGIGLGFLIPIIETARSSGQPDGGLVGTFLAVYRTLGVPFTLEYIVLGVGVVMTARYVSSFLVAWLRAKLRVEYVRDLQTRAFDRALDAEVAYFDEQGSDTVLNAIVTQAEYAAK